VTPTTPASPPSLNSPTAEATPAPTRVGLGLRLVMLGLMGLLLFINYLLWVQPGRGVQEMHRLQLAIAEQRSVNEALYSRNRSLEAEVQNLRQGLEAIEERARVDLGMIREDETFFLILDEFPPILPPSSPLE